MFDVLVRAGEARLKWFGNVQRRDGEARNKINFIYMVPFRYASKSRYRY